MTVTRHPKALANLTARWPNPPNPTTPTLIPGLSSPKCLSGLVEGQVVGPSDNKVLVSHHDVRIAALRDGAVIVRHAIGKDLFGAIVFEIFFTQATLATRPHQATDPYTITDFEFCHLLPSGEVERRKNARWVFGGPSEGLDRLQVT
ncbi:magnesium transporter CorA-like family protein [Striga asiatica]|uniref:Magnesium transporter CorA-like family protein n=1 Tax=Striga asiatica TaxID=4170 RepID=A0A5A7P0E3_STRAF|nr:magnesium transporter CorA-like family protein [Striga asiatica]